VYGYSLDYVGVGGNSGWTGVQGTGTTYGVYGYGNNGVYGEGTATGVIARGGAYGVDASGSVYDFIGGGTSSFGNLIVTGSADVDGDLSFGTHNAKLYTRGGGTCLPGDYKLVSHVPAKTCSTDQRTCMYWYSTCDDNENRDCSSGSPSSCTVAEGWTTGTSLSCNYMNEVCSDNGWSCYGLPSYSCGLESTACTQSADYTICIDDA
ncbi:MAG: hypothetical protein JW789_01365, partial [Candidatus Aenigmarchaeota archaeon]|nr:hypothetical protein [Candidatus Aenigmarchaeota archaeon]